MICLLDFIVIVLGQRELTNKNQKGKYHGRIMLRDVFGYAQDQLKATFRLG